MRLIEGLRGYVIRILRWSERYMKTDMVFVAKGGTLSILSQVIGLAASLILAIVVGHIVPQAVYGEYKYVLSIVAILSFFSLSGLGNAVTQSVARGFEDALRLGFWINLRWSVVVFLGALGLALYYFLVGNAHLGLEILIGGSLSPILSSANLYGSFLAGKRDFVRQITYATVENTIPICFFIAVVFVTQNPIVLVATYFITNTLATLYFYGRTVQIFKPNHREADSEMLRYGQHLSAMNILGGIASNIDQVLLFHYVGAAQLAVYSFATAIPDQIKGPVKTINAMIFSRFTQRSNTEIESSMVNKVFWLFIFAGIVTVVYIPLVPFLFRVLFPAYVSSIHYSQIYALWMLSIAFDPLNVFFLAKKKIREQYVVTLTQSIFKIVGMFVGVILWGVLGVIVAAICAKWFFAILNLVLYQFALHKEATTPSHTLQ